MIKYNEKCTASAEDDHCGLDLICTNTATDTPDWKCRKAINSMCDTTASNNALCGTDLVCDTTLTATTETVNTAGQCRIDYGKTCVLDEHKCATGLVCQAIETPGAGPICHRKAGEICGNAEAEKDDLCASGSLCEVVDSDKKCLLKIGSGCSGSVACQGGAYCP